MKKFIPGLQLNKMFFFDVLQPLLNRHFPKLNFSAGLIGEGSDVLGFDNETSMDHNWGPRGIIVLNEADWKNRGEKIHAMFETQLPYTYKGFSTNFSHEQPHYLKQPPVYKKKGKVRHLIRIFSIQSFFRHYLAVSPYQELDSRDWLTLPQQALLEVTAGEVYYDGLGKLEKLRERFRYYPKDVWLYMMKIQWERMGSELSFPGRTGERGDEVGSSVITSRMINRIMTQCFLMEKHYVPYPKWFGTAFRRLIPARKMTPILLRVLRSRNWKEREQHLGEAYGLLGKMHNALGITEFIPVKLVDFHGRGYKVLEVGKYMGALDRRIRDPVIKKLHYPFGGIDQFVGYKRMSDLGGVWRKFKSVII